MKKNFFALLALALATLTHAASLERDLGHGLVFHRIHQLPADLPTAETTRLQPCVLDLRYVTGDAEAATALAAWLKFHATVHAPVFILANAATSSALIAPLVAPRSGTSVVVVGGAAPGFAPDIALKISPDAERQAYDALEQGAAIETLLTENNSKPRNDEAKLAKDRGAEPAPADDAPPVTPPDGEATAKAKASAPIDVALQRAVHLHRTMLALRKL